MWKCPKCKKIIKNLDEFDFDIKSRCETCGEESESNCNGCNNFRVRIKCLNCENEDVMFTDKLLDKQSYFNGEW